MKRWILPIILIIIGMLLLSAGLYVGQTDDSPGAGGLGIISMLCLSYLAWKMFHRGRS